MLTGGGRISRHTCGEYCPLTPFVGLPEGEGERVQLPLWHCCLVHEGVVITATRSVGVGCGWALGAPPESSFPTNVGSRNMLSLEAGMLV